MANPWLVTGAALTAIAALLHVGCIVFGASWYRFLGAGERMARLAEAGSAMPALITLGIAAVLGTWSLYALSGAGLAPRLPLLRTVLCAIAAVFLLRGVAGVVLAAVAPGERGVDFWLWSSAICLGLGVLYLVGTWRAWPRPGA
jgi:uncharacterized membrane protein